MIKSRFLVLPLFLLLIVLVGVMPVEKDKSSELSSEEKHVILEKGTERPFTGKYYLFFEKGT